MEISILRSLGRYSLLFLIILRYISTEQSSTASSLPNNVKHSNSEPTTETYEFGDSLGDDLRSIAYYLRQYKFNEYDRRYITNELEASSFKNYFKGFPKPPLRSLHWEVHKYCEPSFFECIAYLIKRIRDTALKRNDDTSVVIEDQKWFDGDFARQIEQTDNECQKLWRIGEERSDPFEGPIERFQWRVTASYFLCWFIMKGTPELKHLNESSCDNHAKCLNTQLGAHNKDVRADDSVPFNCAKYSFCPDPCCPIYHIKSYNECWNTSVNPCFEDNTPGNQQCFFNISSNTEFKDIILNRWNISCKCPKSGYRWSSLYGLCVDIDECAEDAHPCYSLNEACLNLPGLYKCVCRWGYSWDEESRKCEHSSISDTLVLRKSSELENEETNATDSFFKRLFVKARDKLSSESCHSVCNDALIRLLILIVLRFSTFAH